MAEEIQTGNTGDHSVCESCPVAGCNVMDNPGTLENLGPQASGGDPLQLFIKTSV